MECLLGYIGIKGCPGADAPASGVYLNSLPGITFKSFEALTNVDANTISALWVDIQALAARMLLGDVVGSLRPKYHLKTSAVTAAIIPTLSTSITAKTAQKRGLLLNYDNFSSPFAQVFIQKARIYITEVPASGLLPVMVEDGIGNTLWTVNVEIVAEDVNKYKDIAINRVFISNNLFVGYDASGMDSRNSQITIEQDSCWCQAVCKVCPSCDGAVFGATVDGMLLDTGNNAFGVQVAAGIGCSFERLICANLSWFTTPFLFLCGNQVMIERLASDRINRWTLIDRPQAEELRDYFRSEYETRLKTILDGMTLDTAQDCCVECAETIHKKVVLP